MMRENDEMNWERGAGWVGDRMGEALQCAVGTPGRHRALGTPGRNRVLGGWELRTQRGGQTPKAE